MTVRTIDEIFRDFVTDGVPASGPFNPHKPDIRDTLKALTEGGETFPDNRVIRLNNANEGTENNIVVTASVAIPAAAYQVLYILNVTQENTGPVTVSGAINRDLVTNINQPIAPGYLIPGMALLCIDTGTELRLLSYGDAEAILAAAEDAAARAEAAAAGLNLPSTGTGDKGKALLVNSDATGYTLGFVEITVDTRSDLKALPVFFKTAYLLEAGREGTFVLKAGSPPVTDTQEGVYVVSNTAGYYWERVYAPMRVPSVTAFGAKLDGVTDDSPAIRGALFVCKEAFIPRTDTGFVAGDIDVNPALGHVISAVGCPTWKIKSTALCAIRVLPGAVAGQYARLSLFLYDGQAAPNTSGAILINTSAGVVLGLRIEGITAKDCGFAYKEEDSTSNYVVDFTIGDTLCYFTRGRQIYSRRSRGFFNWNDIKVDNTYNVAGGRPVVSWNSIYFGDMIGLEFNKLDVVGQVPGSLAHQPNAYGVIIDGIVSTGRGSIYGRRILVDNSTGHGVLITDVFNCEIDIIQGFQVLGAPVTFTRVTNSTFSKVKAYGAKGLTNAVPSQNGFVQSLNKYVVVVSFEGELNTGSGSVMVGCSDCQILGGYSVNNDVYGYYDDNTGDRNRRVGVTARGNTAGSLFQDKASHATYSWTPNSGTPTASTIGAATVA